ncbi:MAG TPA: hypothetical protein VMN78_05480 [Longimicrobiales bacterium]|nr:hypothetical protein [Longimicrobiales bacterium]
MQSHSKAIDRSIVRIAIAQAVGAATLYLVVIGSVMYQVAVAAGYTG